MPSETFWFQQAALPLLALLQLLPLLGAALVYALGERPAAVLGGKLCALAVLLFAGYVAAQVDPTRAGLQLAERGALLGYHVAVDGIAIVFLLLAALLTLLMTLYGMSRGMISPGRLFAVLLLAEAGLVGMLLTLNIAWFAFFSALELWAVVYLLRRWASSRAETQALARFVQYQGFGLALFVAGCFVLGWGYAESSGGRWSFDLFDLSGTLPAGKFQTAAFYLLFYGLAVRTPLFPLHGWLPNMAQHGLIAVAPALMVGVKVGIYGMARFVLPLTPDAVLAWQPYVVGFAMAGVFFTAVLAFLQSNLRRLLAFAVVSHTSLLVIGLFSLHSAGIQGAVLLAANFGLAVTGMWFIVGFVFRRTGTTELGELSGLFERIPFLAVAFLFAVWPSSACPARRASTPPTWCWRRRSTASARCPRSPPRSATWPPPASCSGPSRRPSCRRRRRRGATWTGHWRWNTRSAASPCGAAGDRLLHRTLAAPDRYRQPGAGREVRPMSPLFPELPVLSLLVLLPVGAAGLLWLLPGRLARPASFVAMAAVLALATLALFSYRPESAGFQLLERWPWLTGLGVDWLLAVDGLSVLFLPATALLFLGTLTVAGGAVTERRASSTACFCCCWRRRWASSAPST